MTTVTTDNIIGAGNHGAFHDHIIFGISGDSVERPGDSYQSERLQEIGDSVRHFFRCKAQLILQYCRELLQDFPATHPLDLTRPSKLQTLEGFATPTERGDQDTGVKKLQVAASSILVHKVIDKVLAFLFVHHVPIKTLFHGAYAQTSFGHLHACCALLCGCFSEQIEHGTLCLWL